MFKERNNISFWKHLQLWKNIKSLLSDNVHPYDVSMRIYSKGICAAFGSIKRRYNKFELECYVDIIYVSSSCAVTICSYRSSINLVILVVRFMLIITQNISQFWLQSVMTMSWSYCYNYTRFHGLTVNLVTVCIYIYIHDTFIMHMLKKILTYHTNTVVYLYFIQLSGAYTWMLSSILIGQTHHSVFIYIHT